MAERYQNVDELIELVRPHIFEAKKRECLDLPPTVGAIAEDQKPNTRTVQLTPKQTLFDHSLRPRSR